MSASDVWRYFGHLVIMRGNVADMLRKEEQEDRKHLDPADAAEPLN